MSPGTFVWTLVMLLLLLSGCVAAPPSAIDPSSPTQSIVTPAPATGTPVATDTPKPRLAPVAALPLLCECGNRFILLEQGEATPLGLPDGLIGLYYDFAPSTRHILYGSQFPDHGAGPATLSVTDLLAYDLTSGESRALIADEIVVRAEWAADGQSIVYVAATDATYELRWRSPDGSERLLAVDVSPFFHSAPSGEQIAFTRESPYADAAPGFFVVDLDTGEERQISDLDRGGTGGLEEKPVWTPNQDAFYMNFQRSEELNGLFRFDLDAAETKVTFDPALAEQPWYTFAPMLGVWLSPTEVLGTANIYSDITPMGGQPTVIRYTLDESGTVITESSLVVEGILLGWNVPGESVWVLADPNPRVVALP